MISIETKMKQASNRPAGFDYLRLLLATGVIAQHTVNTSYGQVAAEALFHSPARAVLGLIIPMFFSLSGFLVAGSLERNRTLFSFLGLRGLRLFPALVFEVTLSALLLGVAFTDFALVDYFSAPEFRSYFWNIAGHIHYHLPGVFLSNPAPRVVNGQLWTVPAELKCYLTLAALSLIGVMGRRWLTVWIVLLTQIVLAGLAIRYGVEDPTLVSPYVLVGCFMIGVCAFRLGSSIFLSGHAAILAAVITALLLLIPRGDWFLPIPVTYLTVYLGIQNPRKHSLLLSGDYSYGLYLYGFPIQQAVATQSWTHEWWINFILAYPLAFGLATLSWWLVEKPAMKLKSIMYRVEDYLLRLRMVDWHSRRVFGMAAQPSFAVGITPPSAKENSSQNDEKVPLDGNV